ncbi:hypothetical protein A4G29_01430 [Mycobacterium kansasii]|nr:hypothetical protein A4G29_01430 [Mycobacterium kansasii]
MVEVQRGTDAASPTAEKVLAEPYWLCTVDTAELAVLNLRLVGLEVKDIVGDDWAARQAMGLAAWFLHIYGLLTPSTGGIGSVHSAGMGRPDHRLGGHWPHRRGRTPRPVGVHGWAVSRLPSNGGINSNM